MSNKNTSNNLFKIDKLWKNKRTNGKLLIAFSLYGSKDLYTEGAVQNVLLANKIYPGWTCRFYVDNTVPKKIIEELLELGAQVYVVKGSKITNRQRSLWRFLALGESCRVIFRDTDSRVNAREKHIIEDWCKSGKTFCRIWDSDHPEDGHANPALAGMWGAVSITSKIKNKYFLNIPDNLKDLDHGLWDKNTKPLIPNIEEYIYNWKIPGYRSDEMFMIKYIVPMFKGPENSHMAGCGIEPTPLEFYKLEGKKNGIKYKIKDIKLKNDEDRTSYLDMEYNYDSLYNNPEKNEQILNELFIKTKIKGGQIGDPIKESFPSFKRENLYEYFVKYTKENKKNCRWYKDFI